MSFLLMEIIFQSTQSMEFWRHVLSGCQVATETFSNTCAVYAEDCGGWWCLVVLAKWQNMHWQLMPGTLGLIPMVTACLFTFSFRLKTSNFSSDMRQKLKAPYPVENPNIVQECSDSCNFLTCKVYLMQSTSHFTQISMTISDILKKRLPTVLTKMFISWSPQHSWWSRDCVGWNRLCSDIVDEHLGLPLQGHRQLLRSGGT